VVHPDVWAGPIIPTHLQRIYDSASPTQHVNRRVRTAAAKRSTQHMGTLYSALMLCAPSYTFFLDTCDQVPPSVHQGVSDGAGFGCGLGMTHPLLHSAQECTQGPQGHKHEKHACNWVTAHQEVHCHTHAPRACLQQCVNAAGLGNHQEHKMTSKSTLLVPNQKQNRAVILVPLYNCSCPAHIDMLGADAVTLCGTRGRA